MGYRHVAVGGTFDQFHKGHKDLLKRAVENGDFLTIGISSDRFVGGGVEPYEKRKADVEQYVRFLGAERYSITRLDDPFGPAQEDASMDVLVVSEETLERARELNRLRNRAGLNELEIITIRMILGDDGKVISSSRIRKGEIDFEGRAR